MLSQAQKYKEYLEQDEQIVLGLPGGLWTWEETGRLGIGYSNTPLAFDGAILMPCALIKTRDLKSDNKLHDEAEQVMSFTRTVQIFIYQEGGTQVLEEIFNLMYNSLQDRQPFAGVRTAITNVVEGLQEESLNGANFIRIDLIENGFLEPED